MQLYIVQLTGVVNLDGYPMTGDNDRIMTALIGDTRQSGKTDALDLARVRAETTTLIDPNDVDAVRADCRSTGKVDALDKAKVRANRPKDATSITDPAI